MAHEWDSYFPNLQPPSSDSTTLTSNPGENFSQQAEGLTEHHDFPHMVDSQETPSANLNVNANFYTNSSTSRSDCVYQRYYGDTQWQTGGQQTGNDGPPPRWRGSNLSGLSTSGHCPSSVAYGYDQDCGMLNSPYAEGYSDVSNCSEADANAARSSCKLMNRNSDEMTTCHNSHGTEKPGTWQWPFTSTGNASSPARSHSSTQETPLVVQSSSFSESCTQENVVDRTGERRQNDQLSGVSESVTTSDGESEEDTNEHDDSRVQQQEEQDVEGVKLDTSLGDCGNLTKAEKEGKLNGEEEAQTYLKDLDQEATVVAPISMSTLESEEKVLLDGKVQGNEEVSDMHKDPRPHLISTDDQDNVSMVRKIDRDDELQSSTPEPSDSQSNKETQVQQQERRRGKEGEEQELVQEKRLHTSLVGHGHSTKDDNKRNSNGDETYPKGDLDQETTVVAPNSDGKDDLECKVQGNEEDVSYMHKDPGPHLISTDDQDNVSTVRKVDRDDELQSSTPEPSDSQSNKETQVQQQERRGVEGEERALVQEKLLDASLGGHGHSTEDDNKENSNGDETYPKEDLDQETTVVAPNSDGKDDLEGKVQGNEEDVSDTHKDPGPHLISTDDQDNVSMVRKVDRDDELQSSTPEPSDSQNNETQVQQQERRRGMEGEERALVQEKLLDASLGGHGHSTEDDNKENSNGDETYPKEDLDQETTVVAPNSDGKDDLEGKVQGNEEDVSDTHKDPGPHLISTDDQDNVSMVRKVDRDDELQSSTPEPSDSQNNETQVQQQERRRGMEEKERALVQEKRLDASLGGHGHSTEDDNKENSNGDETYPKEDLDQETTVVAPNSDGRDDLEGKVQGNEEDVSDMHKDPRPHLISTDYQDNESTVRKVDRDDELQASTPEPSDSQSNKETRVQQQQRRSVEGEERALVQEKQLDASLGGHGHSTKDDNKDNSNGEEMYRKGDLDQETTVVAPNGDGKDDLNGKVQGNYQEEVIDGHVDPGPSPISTDGRVEKSTVKKVDQDERLPSSTSEPSHLQSNKESIIQNDTVMPRECAHALDAAGEDDSGVDRSENSQNVGSCLQVPSSCPSRSQDTIHSGPVKDGESDPVGENDEQSSFDLSESCLKKEQSLQQMDTEPPGFNGEFLENARESPREENVAPEQEPTLFGKPLSSEESDCEADETRSESNSTKGDHTGINDEETTEHLEAQTVQFKSSVQMQKCLQPIIILKTSEPANEAYQCAECQQTAQNVDHLIEHHHHCHSQHKFKCCQTCNIYLTSDRRAEKHRRRCGVTEEVPELPVGNTLKRKYKCTPYKCKICSLSYHRFIHYVKHMRTHTGTTPYRCIKCDTYFAQGSSLRKHERMPRRCRAALIKNSKSNAIARVKTIKRAPDGSTGDIRECFVKLVDVSKSIVCHTCSKCFRTVDKLYKHKYNVHRQRKGGASAFPQSAERPKDTHVHKATKAAGKYKCPLCPSVFKFFYNRNRHLRDCVKEITYGNRGMVTNKFPCPLCHTAYTLASNRSRHINNSCLREYIRQLSKTEGISKKNNEETKLMPAAAAAAVKLDRIVPHYKCNLCPAIFLHPSGKYRHEKKHRLFKTTGKLFKYRHSNVGSISMSKRERDSKRERESKRGRESKMETESKDALPSNADRSSSSFTCRFCGKTNFVTSHSLKKHENNHKGERPYRCLECRKGFKKECYLIAHRLVHQRRIQCTVCRKILSTVGELIQHRQSHIKKGMLQCPDCPMKFQFPVYLIRHLSAHHKRDDGKAPELQEPTPQNLQQPLPCQSCGKQFRSRKYTIIHQEKCRTKPKPVGAKKEFICSYCPRVFSRPHRLRKHHVAHKSKTVLPCSKCHRFYGRTKITSHKKNCNDTSEPNVGSSNHNRGLSKNHNLKASNTIGAGANIFLHNCPHCPQKFKYRSFLLRHLQRHHNLSHTREQPYTCMHCGQKYDHKSQYLQHEAFCNGNYRERQSKTKGEVATKLLFMSSLSDEKPKRQADDEGDYKCKFCTKTFTKSRNLRRHILTHTEVKPYRCKACDSCFSRYDHLKVHETRCKGKRQHIEIRIPKISLDDIGTNWKEKLDKLNIGKRQTLDCKTCSRSFSSPTNLARHSAMLHTAPKKSYSCTRCDGSFSHEKSLKAHKKLNKCKRPSIKTNEPLQVGSRPQRGNRTTLPRVANRILQRIQPYSKEKRSQYSCEYCPRFFKSGEQLKVHTRLHTGEKPFQCDDCGEGFIRKDYLLRHSSRCDQRKGTDSVLCDRCGGAFSKKMLKSHQLSCTQTHLPTRSQQPAPPSPPKGFSCACCSSRFLLFSQLQQHFLYAHKTLLKPLTSAPPLQQQLTSIKEEPSDEGYGDRQLSGDGNLLFDRDSGSEDEIVKPLPCPHCDMRFVSKGGLIAHIRVHSGRYPFICKMCKKGFWNKNLHKNHSRKCRFRVAKKDQGTDLESVVPITSEMDPALNDSVLVFDQSSKTTGTGVLQTNFSCKDELKDTQPQTSTEKQEQSGSSKRKRAVQYQCSECDKSFTDGLMLISHLEDHGRVEQEKKKRHMCPKCGKICATLSYLEKHLKAHADETTELDVDSHDPNKYFLCKVCKQRFNSSNALCNHYNEEHPKDVYTCHICDQSYSLKTSLARHYRMKHRNAKRPKYVHGPVEEQNNADGESDTDNEDENDGSEDNDSDSAPYFPCHVCGKTFHASESLVDHQRCHLGEKPHECAECGKCFFHASQLQQHQRSHKSEFQCQTCSRGFVSLFALRKHKHTHGKSRPYRCPKCSLSFKGPSHLADHMASHRDDNFPCDICNRTFSCKSSRVEHRKSHSKSQPGRSLSTSIAPQTKKTTSPATSPSESSSTTPKQLKYRCGVCHDRFKDPEELSEHGCLAAKERPFSCSDCNKHFLHGSHLKRHRDSHHASQTYIYKCTQCKMSFAYRQHYISHLKRHGDSDNSAKDEQGPPKIYKCSFCPAIFAKALKLVDHFSVHSHDTYECKICKLSYTSKRKLEEHERCHQTAGTQYECTECSESFLGSDAFRQHRCSRRRHGTSEDSHPSTAKAQASSKLATGGEEEEVDVTGEDFYNCPICSKRFSSKSGLLEHQNKHHRSERPFQCELCGKTFDLQKYLRRHVLRHGAKIDSDRKNRKNPLVEKPFKCSRCPVALDTAQELSVHMREHAEEEVGYHRCDMCYKSFSHHSSLRQHQESHVGQIVYECNECDKAFAFPHLLEEHQKTHSTPSV